MVARDVRASAGRSAGAAEVLALLGCGLMLAALLAIDIRTPWTYIHDDNGAWTQSVATAHLRAGLAATRGQDFYLRRSDGALVPYLHHPPLYPLVMAAAYGITGRSGFTITRGVPALCHLLGFLGLCVLARRLFPGSRARRIGAAFVYALVPMSSFFGKEPFNEPLGLALCIWATVLAAGYRARPRPAWLAAACAAWTLAIATSWTSTVLLAALAGLFLIESRRDGRPGSARAAAALGATALIAPSLVALHLLWAGRWAPPTFTAAAGHWGATSFSPAGLLRTLAVVFDFHRIYFANVPFALFLAWLFVRARRLLRGGGAAESDRILLAGSVGATLWAIVFARQVSIHAYGQFWFLPFEALAVADLAAEAWGRLGSRRTLRGALAALAVTGTLVSTAAQLRYRYTHPHDYAIRAARERIETYETHP